MTAGDEALAANALRRYDGRVASSGFAAGPIFRLERPSPPTVSRKPVSPDVERARLQTAIDQARADLAALVAGTSGDAADILTFQLALADDETLTVPALSAAASGHSAEEAWQTAVGALIADYEAAEEEYFRARASDLRDLETRVLEALAGGGAEIELPDAAIVVAADLAPSVFLSHSWSGRGIALEAGSPTSHVAMLARSRAVPMLVGLGPLEVGAGEPALLDGAAGSLIIAPDDLTERRFRARHAEAKASRAATDALVLTPAVTANGEPVEVHINIADPAELDPLDPAICDGIGLVRTELLFHGRKGLPGENEQVAVYRRILRWAKGRPVTIRTLDAGGDKPIPGLTLEGELNPFLGLRGVRLSLAHPDVFRTQLRALLRAAPEGPLKIMIPMVSVPAEMVRVRALMDEVRTELATSSVPHGQAALGMMVEVPAAAIALDLFDADFVSIGSNDLVQYTLAAGRDADLGAELADAANPAVIRLIESIVRTGRERGMPVSLCGDAAGDPRVLPELLAAGLRSVSVAPSRVGEVKRVIAAYRGNADERRRLGLASRLGRAFGLSGGRRG
jgi:phosphotransferase system enzyme I (PtsI)